MSRIYSFLLAFSFGVSPLAFGSATHLGRVDLDLSWVIPHGKIESIVSKTVDFRLDWNTKKCEIEFRNVFYYCTLETQGDLKDQYGNTLMKEVPIAHFGPLAISDLMNALAKEDSNSTHLITRVLKDSTSQLSSGFFLPFYTCESCVKNKDRVPVWNAFESFVRRTLEFAPPILGSKHLVLSLKLQKVKPVSGAFFIIGRDNADQYLPQ